jgi:hypothetical protein
MRSIARRLAPFVAVLGLSASLAMSSGAVTAASAAPQLCLHEECGGHGALWWAKDRANEIYGSGGIWETYNSVSSCNKFNTNEHKVTQWACYGEWHAGFNPAGENFKWQINLDPYGVVTYHNP